ncbi:sigma-70 family RNA polymerase sigma factor [Halobacillus rhizosphaerae]|uniref:sigma-70 family RNA polymerase sigma factor n=1 Tax=Halobacillus rhizosphaerae TaxID=3064889 RepID=UPI00398B1AB6
MNEIKAITKAIKGDEDAFEGLIRKESDKLYKTAFLYVRNKEDALDILQETIYKAFTTIHQIKKPEYFSSWLTTILIRKCYDLLNKKKKIVLTDDFTTFPVASNSSGNIEHKLDLITAISKLNYNYQTVIILFYYHDLPIRRISEAMGKPENTVKTLLHRAKRELKQLLGGDDVYGKRMV